MQETKEVKITRLPPGPIDPDLHFDRWQHDNVSSAAKLSRSSALAMSIGFHSGRDLVEDEKNGRTFPKKQAS